ncbi:MAG: DNA repair protein RadC [Candidatus Latescibacteria bacterium]|jgi:DNA repair protein RadC|nr:DNA repair protein RadC [Candidatus Latescibacterota bacterium]
MKRKSIPGVAEVDLPWIKLKERGVEALQESELLAVVLKTGYGEMHVLEACETLLKRHPLSQIVAMDREKLCTVKGLSSNKADLLSTAFELAKRGLNQGLGIAPSITCPADAASMLADIKDKRKEYFIGLYLNARNQVIKREEVSVGSLNASLVHPREVFAPAIVSCAASVVLAHNHPSGDVTPSREDIDLTRRMVQAGDIMGLEIIDHIIVGGERFLSMKESNLF